MFWGCHCIWASASVRGHPREKHLVYVVGAGSRATHCKNAAANGLPLAEKTAKSHSKCHAIGFLAPFRADRATAASDIVYHVAADDLRRRGGPADHKMSVYAWSAFAARTRIGRIDGRRLHEIRARRSGHFSMPATVLHRSESYLSVPWHLSMPRVGPWKAPRHARKAYSKSWAAAAQPGPDPWH